MPHSSAIWVLQTLAPPIWPSKCTKQRAKEGGKKLESWRHQEHARFRNVGKMNRVVRAVRTERCDVMCEAETLAVWLGHKDSEEGDDAGAGRDKSLRWRTDVLKFTSIFRASRMSSSSTLRRRKSVISLSIRFMWRRSRGWTFEVWMRFARWGRGWNFVHPLDSQLRCSSNPPHTWWVGGGWTSETDAWGQWRTTHSKWRRRKMFSFIQLCS